jgi:hypothetical protein
VVARDGERAALAQHRHAIVRVGVIADDVAQAQELRDPAAIERRERRAQGFAIAVDVG